MTGDDKVVIDRDVFDEMMMFLSIYHMMHEEPSERFNCLMKKVEEL